MLVFCLFALSSLVSNLKDSIVLKINYLLKAKIKTANSPSVNKNPPMPKTNVIKVMRNNATNPNISLAMTIINKVYFKIILACFCPCNKYR